ncbi:MAG: 4-(cytidine 5'-diphospho)-2-C-methyl-D-erythritol kinase [Pseudomonadota bacterium]
MMRETAPAKVNLFLHVGPPNDAGRHPLESLTVFADRAAADTLYAEPADQIELKVDGRFAEPAGPVEDNLVYRAARALAAEAGAGASLRLTKNLPVAAGIGGGSADAGAALRLLSRLWGVDRPDLCQDIAARLGGDVPAAFRARPLIMRGEGERVFDIVMPCGVPAVMVNPGVPCPTGPVFRRYDETHGGGGFEEAEPPALESLADLKSWLLRTRNDLEAPAIELAPVIDEVLVRLEGLSGAWLARMSGSGATCFALFDDAKQAGAAARDLSAAHPDWWVASTVFAAA